MVAEDKYWWEHGTDSVKGVATPTVIYVNESFFMYYEAVGKDGISRIALAESRDGLSFIKKGVVLEPLFDWNRYGVNHPFAAIYNDKIILLYVGF